jgi:hypothetical protein
MIENLLEQILHKLNEINQRVAVVESQQGIIMNRMAKLSGGNFVQSQDEEEKPKPKRKPVTQQLKDDTGKGVVGIQVTIFDDNGNVAGQTNTNNAGVWRVFLFPGEYKANYHKAGHISRNTRFTVKETDKIVEIPN